MQFHHFRWNVLNDSLNCDLWDGRKIRLIINLCVFSLRSGKKTLFELFRFGNTASVKWKNNLTNWFSISDQK